MGETLTDLWIKNAKPKEKGIRFLTLAAYTLRLRQKAASGGDSDILTEEDKRLSLLEFIPL